jgi:mannose-6-phosphate isomerase-like protein (cupin superfamily)
LPQYVFDTQKVIRYRFPTHTNDLIMDRQDGAASEAFFVILEPGEAPPLHVHRDAEQVFYILEGEGTMTVGLDEAETVELRVGDFVRTPPGIHHAVHCSGTSRFVYLSIDCCTAGPPAAEPTWDSHVRVMCAEHGWDFDSVKVGQIDSDISLGSRTALDSSDAPSGGNG